jgi:hypothetical protein
MQLTVVEEAEVAAITCLLLLLLQVPVGVDVEVALAQVLTVMPILVEVGAVVQDQQVLLVA